MHPCDCACPGQRCVVVGGQEVRTYSQCVCDGDDGSFALGKINLFSDQTVGVRPEETFHLLDLWRLPGRS